MSGQINTAIIGNGKAGSYLARSFQDLGIMPKVFSRMDGDYYPQLIGSSFDIILLCVPDKVISELSAKIPVNNATLVHISGTTSLNQIDPKHKNTGIFWPLMSLNAETKARINEIPFCLEASSSQAKAVLDQLVTDMILKHYWTSEKQRQKLHLAAVMSQNFSNHLYHLAYKITQAEGLDFEMFKPILMETAKRVSNIDPANRQTGPAARNDEATLNKHLEMLEGREKEIYDLLSQSIRNTK